MSWLDDIPEPNAAELWAIEADAGVLLAELALVDAETALFARPSNAAASTYLRALLDLVDLHDFTDNELSTVENELLEPTRSPQPFRTLEEAS
jgi:hypothetical protein